MTTSVSLLPALTGQFSASAPRTKHVGANGGKDDAAELHKP